MKSLLALAALMMSACAAGPQCDSRLTPINLPFPRTSAAAAAGVRRDPRESQRAHCGARP